MQVNDPNRAVLITWPMVIARATALIESQFGRNAKCYGVPRGGQPIAALFNPVDYPEEADVIVDDLIDSGATQHYYHCQFPTKPFVALFNKKTEPDIAGKWLVFPWEGQDSATTDSERNFTRILQALGQDTSREGLLETPHRFVKYMQDFLTPPAFKFTLFDSEGHDEMIVERNIPFYSLCEHHTLPFFGTAAIGYIPRAKIAGLSKLPRTLEFFARRLQNQERLTSQVAQYLSEQLQTPDVAVVISARHMCMEMRGAKVPGSETVTSKMMGAFMDQSSACRAEFFSLVKK